MRHLHVYDHWKFVQNRSRVHAGINAGTNLIYCFMENLMLYNTSKLQVVGRGRENSRRSHLCPRFFKKLVFCHKNVVVQVMMDEKNDGALSFLF